MQQTNQKVDLTPTEVPYKAIVGFLEGLQLPCHFQGPDRILVRGTPCDRDLL